VTVRSRSTIRPADDGGRHSRVADQAFDEGLSGHGSVLCAGGRDGCYEQRNGLVTSNELIWGDYYFLLETLLALDDVIRPGTL
jgi:hypothetical protein